MNMGPGGPKKFVDALEKRKSQVALLMFLDI